MDNKSDTLIDLHGQKNELDMELGAIYHENLRLLDLSLLPIQSVVDYLDKIIDLLTEKWTVVEKIAVWYEADEEISTVCKETLALMNDASETRAVYQGVLAGGYKLAKNPKGEGG